MTERQFSFDSLWLILPAALLMYVSPWAFNTSVTLSLGAYDFAEFLAKRPFNDVTYLTTLALRGQLVLFTWLIAASCQRAYFTMRWWVYVIAALILVVAQLPPVSFISNLNDTNQQQQAMLALISLIGAIIGFTGITWQYRAIIRLIIAVVGIVSTIYGVLHIMDVMEMFSLSAQIGIGGIGLVIVYTLMGFLNLYQFLGAPQE